MNNRRFQKWNYWPINIVAAFVVFAAGLAVFIVFATSQRLDLVRPDYYDAEMRYQQQRNRLLRTARFTNQIDVRYDARRAAVIIELPAAHARHNPSGRIHFYRPSNAALDRNISVAVDASGLQEVQAGGMASGLWKIRVSWVVDDEEFFVDQSVVITGQPS